MFVENVTNETTFSFIAIVKSIPIHLHGLLISKNNLVICY